MNLPFIFYCNRLIPLKVAKLTSHCPFQLSRIKVRFFNHQIKNGKSTKTDSCLFGIVSICVSHSAIQKKFTFSPY